jgi:hypothetical protein
MNPAEARTIALAQKLQRQNGATTNGGMTPEAQIALLDCYDMLVLIKGTPGLGDKTRADIHRVLTKVRSAP